MFKRYKNKKAFTIIELIIVLAVISILSAVLIPTFSGVMHRANESAALSEARNGWTAVLAEYFSYDNFRRQYTEESGWFYDAKKDIMKYHTLNGEYTVTFDGEEYLVNPFDGTKFGLFEPEDEGSGTVISFNDLH